MRRTLAALAALALLMAAAPAGAQLSEGEIQIVDLDATGYPTIEVTVDVPRSFADTTLTADEFSLDEGGVAREITVEKLAETTGIVLAIDTSGSMAGEAIAAAKASALAFVDGLPDSHPVAVVGFGDSVVRASELTTDRAATRNAIGSLRATGETSLYDALIESASILQTAGTDRVALVLLSDGADTASSATPDAVVGALTSSDVALYSIGLETGDSQLSELSALTDRAGGAFLSTTALADLAAVYDGLAARLANQYRLRFEATSSGPVEVRVVAVSGDRLAGANLVTELKAADAAPAPTTSTDPQASTDPQFLEAVPFLAPPKGMLEAGWVMWAGLGALGFAFATVSYAAFSMAGDKPRRRLEPRATPKAGDTQLSGVATWASGLVDRTFLNGTRRGAMNAALDRAGLNLRPGEFIVLVGCVSVAVLALGWLMHPLIGIIGAIVVALSARSFVGYMGSRRRNRFANQLDNTLLVMAGSLRAGHGIQRALVAVAEESDSPTGEEFTRVVAETRIGRDLVEALQGIADRLGNEDFEWVVRAVAINRELGGNLSEVLDNVGDTIRERNQLRRQVSALSAEGKLSAIVLYVLPFGVAGFVRLTNPTYLSELTKSNFGLGAIGLAILLMIGGGAWIKKIVQVQF